MSRLKNLLPFLGFACLISYFAYHTFTGEQSVGKLMVYHQREAALAHQLAALQACRSDLEKRVNLLSDQSLDLDYLEQRARAVLYMADARDVLVQLGDDGAVGGQGVAPCDQTAAS